MKILMIIITNQETLQEQVLLRWCQFSLIGQWIWNCCDEAAALLGNFIPFTGDYTVKLKERPSAFIGHGIVVSIPTTPFPWRETRAKVASLATPNAAARTAAQAARELMTTYPKTKEKEKQLARHANENYLTNMYN